MAAAEGHGKKGRTSEGFPVYPIECGGNSLIFTDLHVGISNDKASRQKIAENVVDEIIGLVETEDVRQVFFLGDLFHQRTSIEVTSLNVANDLVRKLESACHVYLLQGNHDLYEKYNSVITSLNIFDLENVDVVSTPTELKLNGQRTLLVPWLCGASLEDFVKPDDIYDIMMGHFDISYSGDIQYKGSRYANSYKSGSGSFAEVEKGNIVDEILHHTHDFSTIYMGHIHDHETLTFENRTWNIVGSPQYQVHDMKRLPDEKKMHGYFILNSSNEETFHQTASIPRFVTLYASDVVSGKVDEDKLKGSVVRRCYDVVLDDRQKAKMDDIVSRAKVYEEDSAVFMLGISSGSVDGEDELLDSTEGMFASADKFDYIREQVDKIHHEAIDNAKLLEMMREYYDRAF